MNKEELLGLISSEKTDELIEVLDNKLSQGTSKNALAEFTGNWNKIKLSMDMNSFSFIQVKGQVIADFENLWEICKVEINDTKSQIIPSDIEEDTSQNNRTEQIIEIEDSNATINDEPDEIPEIKNNLFYVGFGRRALALFLEGLILAAIAFLIQTIVVKNTGITTNIILIYHAEKLWYVAVLSGLVAYLFKIFLIVIFGGNLGKLILGYRIIDKNTNYLNVKKAILRDSPYIIIGIVYSFFTYLFIKNIEFDASFFQQGQTLPNFQGRILPYIKILQTIALIRLLFFAADVLVVIVNKNKEAIHDYIAGSYVVTKKSLKEVKSIK